MANSSQELENRESEKENIQRLDRNVVGVVQRTRQNQADVRAAALRYDGMG